MGCSVPRSDRLDPNRGGEGNYDGGMLVEREKECHLERGVHGGMCNYYIWVCAVTRSITITQADHRVTCVAICSIS